MLVIHLNKIDTHPGKMNCRFVFFGRLKLWCWVFVELSCDCRDVFVDFNTYMCTSHNDNLMEMLWYWWCTSEGLLFRQSLSAALITSLDIARHEIRRPRSATLLAITAKCSGYMLSSRGGGGFFLGSRFLVFFFWFKKNFFLVLTMWNFASDASTQVFFGIAQW